MDSSNSGSFQSSSGGGGGGGDNDDYGDSTTQSPISSSFFSPPPTNLNHLLHSQPPPPSSSYHHRPPPTFFNNPSSAPPPFSTWTGPINNLPDFGTYTSNMDHTQPKTPHRGSDHQIGVAVKNPKKRTRASRRAPTTVLTTDTTNFRQMVQEFTGIPTTPFTAAPFSRRLDLIRPTQPQQQQQRPPPFLNNNSTTTTNYPFAPSTINNFQKQPSTFLDLQNPMFSFQSLLQNSLPQQSGDLSNSSKRWSDQNGKMETFEGVIGNAQNIGGSKLNSGIENVLTGGDQVQGNEASWICPSN